MKNKLSFLAVLIIGFVLVLGCGITERVQKAVEGDKPAKSGNSSSSGSDKSLEDKAIDTVFSESTGIPECDEVIALIDQNTNNKEDGWGTKAIKGYFLEQIKKGIRESIEQNKNDKKTVAENCKIAKDQVQKALAEEKNK